MAEDETSTKVHTQVKQSVIKDEAPVKQSVTMDDTVAKQCVEEVEQSYFAPVNEAQSQSAEKPKVTKARY